MSLIPRWRFMTSEAKALVRTMGISVILLLLVLLAFRILAGLLWPMVLVGFLLWLLFFRR
ncbi:MAG: hypothetical protein TE42_07195 [Candidatus Synechococcus spongiarum SP3]|uniref:Uncharacterized protein n=1 Tax=Candidatus Synechococcus spongiarum SP3 TaxID=1604020 RepID=A0A0G2HK83_9SYNE|nr:MAG: hypothetical protein TE42_07195 [Candidatus Synechococcus spongiarum SP3]